MEERLGIRWKGAFLIMIMSLLGGYVLGCLFSVEYNAPDEYDASQGTWSGPAVIEPDFVTYEERFEERVSALEKAVEVQREWEPLHYWAFIDADNHLTMIYSEPDADGNFQLMLMERADHIGWCEPVILYP